MSENPIYIVENSITSEAINRHPALSNMLGTVSESPQRRKTGRDGIERDVYYVTEGSAMYGLSIPDDAVEWSGIFNHVAGNARNLDYLSRIIAGLTNEQKEQFVGLGYSLDSIDSISPDLLVEFTLGYSHSGRRRADETKRYSLTDAVHTSPDPETSTLDYLRNNKAPAEILELMKAENHQFILGESKEGSNGINIVYRILEYCDWRYNQKPITLKERFDGLRASQRLSDDDLNRLEQIGIEFENDLIGILGQEVIDAMNNHVWEDEALIREGYCASAGLEMSTVFPEFAQRQQVK